MVCDVLKELVKRSGKTQKEIASDLQLTQQRFNFYVTGKREPDNEMLIILSNYFGVSTDYLLKKVQKEKPIAKIDDKLVNPIDLKIVELLKKMNPRDKAAIMAQIDALANLPSDSKD